MIEKQPKRLSLERFREIFEADDNSSVHKTYVGKGYVVARHALTMAKRLIASGDPFLLEDLRVGIVTSGEADVLIGLKPFHFKRGSLIFANKEIILQMSTISSDFDISIMMVTQQLFGQIMFGEIPQAFDSRIHAWTTELTEEEAIIFLSLLDILRTCSITMGLAYDMITDQVASILHFYQYIYNTRNASVKKQVSTRAQEIFDRFIFLVNETKGTQRQLAYFADKLCLSQRYVGSVIKRISGLSAKEWIDRATIANIKLKLHHHDLSITEVSDQLMFPTVSFFSKYFKRLTGMTPMEYKNS